MIWAGARGILGVPEPSADVMGAWGPLCKGGRPDTVHRRGVRLFRFDKAHEGLRENDGAAEGDSREGAKAVLSHRKGGVQGADEGVLPNTGARTARNCAADALVNGRGQ